MFSATGLLLALVAACSGDGLAPNDRVLVGQWGSDEAELIALLAGAELRFGCATAVIDDPIVLSPANTFSARARVFGPGARFGDPPVARLSGSVGGSQVTINVPSVPGVSAATLVLNSGVARPPLEDPVCPL